MNARTTFLAVLLVLVAITAGGYYYMNMPKEQPPAPLKKAVPAKEAKAETAADKPAEAAKPAETPPPAAPTTPAASQINTPAGPEPVVLSVLGLMPEKTQLAVGIPPLTAMNDKVVPVVQKVFKSDLDVQAEFDRMVRETAAKAGVQTEGNYAEAWKAMGLNPEGPAAVFLNASGAMDAAIQAMSAAAAPEAPGMDDARFAAVLPVADAALAETTLKSSFADALKDVAPQDEDAAGGVKLHVYPEMGAYAVTDKLLVFGNDNDMVKGVLARAAGEKAQFRYGSPACPAQDANELVVMMYGKEFIPAIGQLVEIASSMDPASAALIKSQMAKVEGFFSAEQTDDPLLFTLGVMDDRIEMRSLLDTATHPGVSEYMGASQPFRLTPSLPDNTLAFLTLRINEQTKEQFKGMLPPDLANDPQSVQIKTYVDQVMEMLGEEVTIGVTDLSSDFPSIYAMVAVTNPAAAQMLLALAGAQLLEEHNGAQINKVTIPSPIPVVWAFADDVLIVSNDPEGIKGMIDRVKAKQASNFFASQVPPIDPSVARYSGFFLRSSLYTDVVRPIATLMAAGTIPPEVDGIFTELAKIVRDMRVMAEMNGTWYDSRMSLMLEKSPEAAAAPAPAQ